MEKELLKEVLIEQTKEAAQKEFGIPRAVLQKIEPYHKLPHTVVLTGIRRCGKSTLLRQIIRNYYAEQAYYFSFEDERLLNFEVADFNVLYELSIELFQRKQVFFLDEIQNIPCWENFVRRMQEQGKKFYITGSNASLLSKELATKLTGRTIVKNVYPFSFQEFLAHEKHSYNKNSFYETSERAKLKKIFRVYLQNGGMPEFLKYREPEILKGVYEDILYRDILARYEIKDIRALRELSFYLLSNTGSLFSYNKLKQAFHFGSVNTVKNYIEFLENSYLFFTVPRFSFSIKQQTVAHKKIYCVDNGFLNHIAIKFSANTGKFLENLVFMHLKQLYSHIYYYQTKDGFEVDFLVSNDQKNYELFQVSANLENALTEQREIRALIKAMSELKINKSYLINLEEEKELKSEAGKINILPGYKWFLQQ